MASIGFELSLSFETVFLWKKSWQMAKMFHQIQDCPRSVSPITHDMGLSINAKMAVNKSPSLRYDAVLLFNFFTSEKSNRCLYHSAPTQNTIWTSLVSSAINTLYPNRIENWSSIYFFAPTGRTQHQCDLFRLSPITYSPAAFLIDTAQLCTETSRSYPSRCNPRKESFHVQYQTTNEAPEFLRISSLTSSKSSSTPIQQL